MSIKNTIKEKLGVNKEQKKEKRGKRKKETLQSPKGMRDIFGEEYYNYQGFFEKAQEIAMYYGFKPINTPVLESEELFRRGVGEATDIVEKEMFNIKTRGKNKLVMRPEATSAIVRAYLEHGMQSWTQPVYLYTYGPFFRHERPQKGRFREFRQFDLEILGTSKSIADAIIISTTFTILKEAGFDNLSVKINSIGDQDCRGEYIKKLVTYYKKHSRVLCPDCKNRLSKNPLRLLDCKKEDCQKLKEKAPLAIESLCVPCKKHFKEVLESLDMMEIPYELDSTLVRGLDYYTRTVFEIIAEIDDENENPSKLPEPETEPTNDETENVEGEEKEEEKDTKEEKTEDKKEVKKISLVLAGGGRYDYLAKMLGSKEDIPAVGVGIGVDRVLSLPQAKKLAPRIMKKPKIYFIQLGFEARLKSLKILEILRKARIPILQSLSKDGLSAQLGNAEKSKVPYVIIFGQKEALEKSVIVRSMANHSQETVKIDNLPDHLRKLK